MKRYADLLNLIDKKDVFNATKFMSGSSKTKESEDSSYQLRDKFAFSMMLNRFYEIVYKSERNELRSVIFKILKSNFS